MLLAKVEDQFLDDKDIVSLAVRQNGLALEHASFNLRNDYYIVDLAVGQNGVAI